MSALMEIVRPWSPLIALRALCAGLGVIVIIDALSVQAPGLALLGLPFLLAGAALREGGRLPMAALALVSGLFVAIGVMFAVSNGFDAGWGDLLFAYAGTPVAVAIGLLAATRMLRRS